MYDSTEPASYPPVVELSLNMTYLREPQNYSSLKRLADVCRFVVPGMCESAEASAKENNVSWHRVW